MVLRGVSPQGCERGDFLLEGNPRDDTAAGRGQREDCGYKTCHNALLDKDRHSRLRRETERGRQDRFETIAVELPI